MYFDNIRNSKTQKEKGRCCSSGVVVFSALLSEEFRDGPHKLLTIGVKTTVVNAHYNQADTH